MLHKALAIALLLLGST